MVESKDKIGAVGAWEASSARRGLSPEDQKVNDAVLALMALGFKQVDAHDAVRKAISALGAQAGEARLREVITAGGFRSVRRAAETPFNMILEARL